MYHSTQKNKGLWWKWVHCFWKEKHRVLKHSVHAKSMLQDASLGVLFPFFFHTHSTVSLLLMHSNTMGKKFCSALCIGISSEMCYIVGDKWQKKESHTLLLWRAVDSTAWVRHCASRGKINGHRGSIILQPSHSESAGHSIVALAVQLVLVFSATVGSSTSLHMWQHLNTLIK